MIDFRFNGQELILWIGDTSSVIDVLSDITSRLKNMGSFFSDEGGISIFFEGGTSQAPLVASVVELLEEYNVKVNSIHFVKPERRLNKQLSDNIKKSEVAEEVSDERVIIEKNLKLFKMTVRSGQVFEYDGDALIIGNINKGGQVRVTGNLIVLGDIKGNINVGLYNPEEAFVLSTSMHPNIIQIGNTHSSSISSDETALCKIKNGRLSLEPLIGDFTI
ncbi:MAG TPA: septum site-determining protein MinC [Thermotogota bacterium]|mgnify:CR=1 FL=1|nr:septum site-determining protein MinC [Thermotogota bacterium]HPJ88528.1 septum site-determining protein MinC [Thermotogota bacterium]HPR96462.1 septum site-determining protein MinC [Thermotogota bacterium]